MSFPFQGEQFTFTQPDGSKLPVIGWGDQNYGVFETLDGYTLVKDPVSGFYEYARLQNDELVPTGIWPGQAKAGVPPVEKHLRENSRVISSRLFSSEGLPPGNPRWKIRREEAKKELIMSTISNNINAEPPDRSTIGDYLGVCLLIQFPDVPGTIPREEVDAFCNQQGYRGFNNNGSVRDYFFENSQGKFRYNNIVLPYYTAKNNREFYTDRLKPMSMMAKELIKEALAFHKSNGVDFSMLTSDSFGFVFALNVFYAGEVVNNFNEGLWPHSSNLSGSVLLAPGKFASDYQITNMGAELSLGIFCHESGHMVCDFPDLYDQGNQSSGVGNFCLMGFGGNVDKKNPTQVSAYLKFKAGWSDNIQGIAPSIDVIVPGGINNFVLHKKNNLEYYIIEHRLKTGRDLALPDQGLAIWHVDEMGSNNNEQMTPILHYECSLVQADGRNELEQGLNKGNPGDLFKATSNNRFGADTNPASRWWDGTNINMEIESISAEGNQISIKIK